MCYQSWIRADTLLTLFFPNLAEVPETSSHLQETLGAGAAKENLGSLSSLSASETEQNTPTGHLLSLWSSREGHKASSGSHPTASLPQTFSTLQMSHNSRSCSLRRSHLKQQLPPSTAGAHPGFLCFLSSTERPQGPFRGPGACSLWLKVPQGLFHVAKGATGPVPCG